MYDKEAIIYCLFCFQMTLLTSLILFHWKICHILNLWQKQKIFVVMLYFQTFSYCFSFSWVRFPDLSVTMPVSAHWAAKTEFWEHVKWNMKLVCMDNNWGMFGFLSICQIVKMARIVLSTAIGFESRDFWNYNKFWI